MHHRVADAPGYEMLGRRIVELVDNCRMSQKELATELEVSASWLNQVIHGGKPGLALVRRMDSFFDTGRELEEMLRDARTPPDGVGRTTGAPATTATLPQQFFFTQDDRPDTTIESVGHGAHRVSLIARTAISILGQYQRAIEGLLGDGCTLRIALVRPDPVVSHMVYGTSEQTFAYNHAAVGVILGRWAAHYGTELVQVRLTHLLPTVGILMIERADPSTDCLYVQLYFLYGPIGRDRPLFAVPRHDRWYPVFVREFEDAWAGADPWVAPQSERRPRSA